MEILSFFIKNKVVNVKVKRTGNKNMYLKVNKANEIEVSAPKMVLKRTIEKFVEQHIERFENYVETKRKNSLFSLRENFLFFKGKKLRLSVLTGFLKTSIKITGSSCYVNSKTGEEKEVLEIIDKFLRNELKKIIEPLQKIKEKEMRLPNHKIRISDKNTSWGSNNIRLASISYALKLIHFSNEVIEYVVIHELAHSIVPDHSNHFWTTVEQYCPNYRELKKILRSDSSMIEE